MLTLLARRPAFLRLFLAGAISLVGDWLTLVAVSLLAVGGSGGPLSLAVVFAAHALPQALGAPIAGPLADRFDRRTVLLCAYLGQGALTVMMALAALAGSLPALSLLVLVRSAVSALVVPAETGALRRVVQPEELLQANALVFATWSASYVVGMALGGALATLGPALAIGLDAATFAIAAVLTATLPPLPVDRGDEPSLRGSALFAAPRDMLAALRHVLGEPALLRVILAKSPIGIAGGAGFLALNLIAASARPFGSAALSLGLLQAIRGAGTGIGPLAATRMVAAGLSPDRLGHVAAAASLGSMTLFACTSQPVWLGLSALGWGVGSGTNWVLSSASLQRLAPDRMIGRLASLDELLATLTMVASALVGGALLERGAPVWLVVTAFAAGGAALWLAVSIRTRPAMTLGASEAGR